MTLPKEAHRASGIRSPQAAREAVHDALRRSAPARRQRWTLARTALGEFAGDQPIRLLDVGCEDGLLTVQLARAHPRWRLIGVDIFMPALREADGERARVGVDNVLFAQADATRTMSGPVDAVLALECLAEIPDHVAAIGRFAEALRAGGLLVAHVPAQDWRPVLSGSPNRWRREVRHGYTQQQITALLEQAGFADVRVLPTMRGTVTLAQEIRDRFRHSPRQVRAALHPLFVAAAAADLAGATWGPGRGLFVQARRAAVTSTDLLLAPPAEQPVAAASYRSSFSVVVAAWQSAGTVGAAVASALAQTEPALEVIVCDDGSTDDVAGALAGFGDAVRLLRIDHGGESAAKNAAVAAASGEFVVILDADDLWDSRRLARLGDLAQQRPDLDLLTTDAWFMMGGQRGGLFYGNGRSFPILDQSVEILRRNFLFAHVAVRRSVWLQHGGFAVDVTHAADWEFWIRLMLEGHLAGCVDEPLADYVIHDASLSADRSMSLNARVQVLDRVNRDSLTNRQSDVLQEARAEFLRRGRRAAAEGALKADGPVRRLACLQLAATPGLGLSARAKAVSAAALPSAAAALLRRQSRLNVRSSSDRYVPSV